MVSLRAFIVLLTAVAGALVTARLGLWQLDRAAQKTAWHESLVARGALPALAASQLARTVEAAAEQQHRRVVLEGRWLASRSVYLDNRQMNGRPGFFVVTPLQIAPDDVVLVQRGWVPRNALERERLAAVDTPTGAVRIEGRIAPGLARLYEFDSAVSGVIRQNLDVAEFARETGLALRPLAVVQLDGAATPADGLLRQWTPPVLDVSKHHGYALQWFALSTLITGLYVWFQLIHPRRRRSL
ncbi:MAG: transrane cytochrome oxidase [Proteobacteria bacterium]|nr:transrane cytochrome oxidase [Pseudomonadota bacterium]